jgi:hypothetical protein
MSRVVVMIVGTLDSNTLWVQSVVALGLAHYCDIFKNDLINSNEATYWSAC